ncbi:putative olfactory receptor 10D4 [Emydura macquarii macquarii]|uniref:putative olfactory receptor 10D4 n=1 Tax=Emydura macquarii macquarii TaxID=1129001 RepID=UPI00352A3490
MSQVVFYQFLGCTEGLLYTIMAFDRYVAICHPLCYLIIMNWRVCAILGAGTWVTSSFHATILTSLIFTLPYCRPNVVDYFFCDIFRVVKLACADTNDSHMGLVNLTVVTHFILSGIPNTDGLQTILFVVFSAFYLCTLLGNLLILSAIRGDSRLHTPMYFFLCNLAVVDLGLASVITFRLLANLCGQSRVISLGGCMSQVFFYWFLGYTECLLCTVMAFDSLTFTLPYCGPNTVDYFVCDIFSVAKLACVDTYVIKTVTSSVDLVPTTCFLLILISYVRIVYSILKMNSAEGRRKAAATCASHLTVVTLFFGPCVMFYMQLRLSKAVAAAVDISSDVVPPMLNPVIYTLRNKDMKGALRKLRGGQTTAR